MPMTAVTTSQCCRFSAATYGIVCGIAVLIWGALAIAATAARQLDDYRVLENSVGGEFTLTDHRGQAAALKQFRGKVVLIFFGYTSCPDICPLTLVQVKNVLVELGEEAEALRPLFITVDPARDTPPRLREFVAHFHESIVGLTGTEAEVIAAAQQFGTQFMKVEGDSADSYTMAHTGYIYLLDRGGNVQFMLPHDADAALMLAGVKSLLAGG